MEKQVAHSNHDVGQTTFVLIVLSLLFAVGLFAWPSFRTTSKVGLNVITRPFLKLFFPKTAKNLSSSIQSAGQLARNARSMEFRIQQYPVTPALLNTWCSEWNCTEDDKKILLTLLLRTLPEAVSNDTPSPERVNLIQSMGQITQDGMKNHPENAFYPLVNGLILFYTGQDSLSLDLLKQSQAMPKIDCGLKDLNQSEYALWNADAKIESLFPRMPRIWGLRLERPFHTWSRGLALQERGYLQKYNLEKAVDTALVHLALAKQISEIAWTPFDFSVSQAIKHRALDAFWTQKSVEPNEKQLEENFINFLDEQADKLSSAKARSWMETIDKRQQDKLSKLPRWRLIQSFSIWNASSILGSLYMQTVSLLIVWATLIFFMRRDETPAKTNTRAFIPSFAFFVAPFAWMLLGWPAGGTYMLLGVLASWLLWLSLLYTMNLEVRSGHIYLSISHAIIAMTTSALIVTITAAYVLDYRMSISSGFLN